MSVICVSVAGMCETVSVARALLHCRLAAACVPLMSVTCWPSLAIASSCLLFYYGCIVLCCLSCPTSTGSSIHVADVPCVAHAACVRACLFDFVFIFS